jgi:hypothetical protein
MLPVYALQWGVACLSVGAAVALIGRTRRGRPPTAAPWDFVVWPGLAAVILPVLIPGRVVEPTQTIVRSTLLLIPLASLLEAAAPRWRLPARAAAVSLAAAAIAILAASIVVRQTRSTIFVSARAGAVWSASDLSDVEWLQSHTRPGELVFLFPDKGGLFFLTRTANATSYPELQDMDLWSPEQVRHATAELAQRRPRVGIFDTSRLFSGGPIESSSLRPLHRFLIEHYRTIDGRHFVLAAGESPAN